MPILDVIQQHLNNGEQGLAHDAAAAAGLIVGVCCICHQIKDAQPSERGALSHGFCTQACVDKYLAEQGRRVA